MGVGFCTAGHFEGGGIMRFRLRTLALVLLGFAVVAPWAPPSAASPTAAPTTSLLSTAALDAAANPIAAENARPGTGDWRIPWPGRTVANDTSLQVKGYASQASVAAGETMGLHITSNPGGRVRYDVYRLGWYGGQGGRFITGSSVVVPTQPPCPLESGTGLRECRWPRSVTFGPGQDWTTGVYVIVLTNANNFQNYIVFTLRESGRRAPFVHMQPIFTYQAYNNFPNDKVTGKSLYDYNSYGPITVNGSPGAVKVSFDRPYANHGAGNVWVDDAPFIRWAEARGFDIAYATNGDLHADPMILDGRRGFFSVGHDEYWTGDMFTTAEAARDKGVNAGYFGANDVYWQVRLEASKAGTPGRTVVCYRQASLDPEPDPLKKTVLFRNAERPEQPLIGMMWSARSSGMLGADADWVVTSSSHWVYGGTGLTQGAKIPKLVGGEADQVHHGYPLPAATDYDVLARSPYIARDGVTPDYHESTLYVAPSGANTFAAGTLRFPIRIGGEGTADLRVQTMGTNMLARYAGAQLTGDVVRRGGADRYETAVELSRNQFAPGVEVAYIATGATFPDALVAGPGAGSRGPVLLVGGTQIPEVVSQELARLQPQRIVVVGGPAIVSDGVMTSLKAFSANTVRLYGFDRYATAVAISKDRFAPGVPVTYIATGVNYPDALAAGAAGARLGGPVLLTRAAALDAATKAELGRLKPQRIVVVGGPTIVSAAVENAAKAYAPQVVRRYGSDRFRTAVEISRDYWPALGAEAAVLATGLQFPDALAAGPVAAAMGGPLLLVHGGPPHPAYEEIVRIDPARVVLAGGEGALPAAVKNAAEALFTGPLTTPPSAARTEAQPTPTVPEDLLQLQEPPQPTDEPYIEQEDPRSTELPWLEGSP
jgi:putative cell wall-binding protein